MVTYGSKLISIEISVSSNLSLNNPFSSYFSRILSRNIDSLVVFVCCVAQTNTCISQIFVLIRKKLVQDLVILVVASQKTKSASRL